MIDSTTDLWIESHAALDHHDKLKLLAFLLVQAYPNLRPFELSTAEGLVHRLWHWALYNALDGNLANKTDLQLALAVDWPGEPSQLLAFLMESRFVDALPYRQIHDWHVYAGHLIRGREAAARKASRNRELYAHTRLTNAAKQRDGMFCRLCGRGVSSLDKKSPSGIDYVLIDPAAGYSVANIIVACRADARAVDGRALADLGILPQPPRGTALPAASSVPALPPAPGESSVGKSSANRISQARVEATTAAPPVPVPVPVNAENGRSEADVGKLLADNLSASRGFDPACLSQPLRAAHAVLSQWPEFRPNAAGYAMIEREHSQRWPAVDLERAALGYLEFEPQRARKRVTMDGFMSWLDNQQRIVSEAAAARPAPVPPARPPLPVGAGAAPRRDYSHIRTTLT